MKKITILLSLMYFSLGYSQTNPINFETGGNGATWTWNAFENPSTPCAPMIIGANPSPTGINTSATVASYTPVVGAPFYAGVETAIGSPLGTFNLSTSNCTVKIWVYKPVISNVGIKFAAANGASTGEVNVPNTLINQWEELTFNFSSKIGEPSSTGIRQLVIFMDSNAGRTTNNTCYFDNIRFSAQIVAPLQVPAVAAVTPTRPAANVISLFSNAYTNIAMGTWQTSWSAAPVAVTDIQVAGNDTKRYTGLDFVGIEPAAPINATAMNSLHIDIWSPNMTTFKVKLVNAATAPSPQSESELTFTPTQNGWNYYDIPLANFTGLNSRAAIFQIILVGAPAGSSVLYVDNVYFHNAPVVDLNTPQVAAPAPTRLPANVISLFSNAYTNVPVDTWQTSWSSSVLTDVQIAGNATKKYTAGFVGVETIASQINATNMTHFHYDAWTSTMTEFKIKLVDFGANGVYNGPGQGDDREHELVFTPTLSGWNSYDLLLSSFTGLTTRANISQIIFVGGPSGTMFIDNVYFANTPLSNTNFATAGVKMYPNPASDIFTIEAIKAIDSLQIFNMLGQEVFASTPKNNVTTVDVSRFNTGVYLVKITADNVSSTARFVKK